MRFLSIYASYIKMYFKARMEYRFSFFSGMIANFYSYLVTYLTFWVIAQRFGVIAGWKFEEMVILYGFNLFSYSLAGILFWHTLYLNLEDDIVKGNLDAYLIRPMGFIKQMVCKRFGDTFLGQVLVTLVFMIPAVVKISYQMTLFSYIYLVFAIFGGVLIQAGGMIIFGSISFWVLRAGESLPDLFYYDLRSFVHYPLSIFPSFIRIVLTYILPWAFINYYPSLIILHKVQTTEEFVLGILSPLIGVLFFLLSLFIFNRGLRRYSGSGS